jgi:hypothetical protein
MERVTIAISTPVAIAKMAKSERPECSFPVGAGGAGRYAVKCANPADRLFVIAS